MKKMYSRLSSEALFVSLRNFRHGVGLARKNAKHTKKLAKTPRATESKLNTVIILHN